MTDIPQLIQRLREMSQRAIRLAGDDYLAPSEAAAALESLSADNARLQARLAETQGQARYYHERYRGFMLASSGPLEDEPKKRGW